MFIIENLSIFGPGAEWFWLMCQFFAVSITLLFILRQIRLQNDSHLINSFACLESRWNSIMMQQARRMTCERYGPDITSIDQPTSHVGYFFEELGIYCKRGILDKDIVWEIYSFHIEHFWIMAKNRITCFRRDRRDETFYKNFEHLYHEMLAINRKKGAPIHEKTSEDIASFIAYELGIIEFIEHTRELNTNKGNDQTTRTDKGAT
jgi:hypothetical protein